MLSLENVGLILLAKALPSDLAVGGIEVLVAE